MSSKLLEEMNARQVKKDLNKNTIAILVFGACENHGDHMPFSSDFIFPMELAKKIHKNPKKRISLFFRLFHTESAYIIMNFK